MLKKLAVVVAAAASSYLIYHKPAAIALVPLGIALYFLFPHFAFFFGFLKPGMQLGLYLFLIAAPIAAIFGLKVLISWLMNGSNAQPSPSA